MRLKKERGMIMLAILALLVPPLLLVFVRSRVLDIHMSRERNVLSYLFSTLGLNWLMMLILYICFHNNSNLFENLNSYLNFACKYIALSCLIAVAEPFVERFIKGNFHFSFSMPCVMPTFRHWRLCAIVYSVVLFLLNFIRIFDNNFWGTKRLPLTLCSRVFRKLFPKQLPMSIHPFTIFL